MTGSLNRGILRAGQIVVDSVGKTISLLCPL